MKLYCLGMAFVVCALIWAAEPSQEQRDSARLAREQLKELKYKRQMRCEDAMRNAEHMTSEEINRACDDVN